MRRAPAAAIAVAVVLGVAAAGAASTPAVPLERMLGQRLMVRMTGLSADRGLLARIRAGRAGGVILYSENISSPRQVARLVAQLQAAAKAGGNPPLLISTDQEGGQVKRLPWAAPTLTPPAMGARGAAVSAAQGRATGLALHHVGINVDLAPVADVAHSSSAFIWRQGRAFGMDARRVTLAAGAFASALQTAGVAATAKHFPGVGSAATDTDSALVALPSRADDLTPYRSMIPDGVAAIMVSTAIYPALDSSRRPAALSSRIIGDLLRGRFGFKGVVMTDDLERPTGYSAGRATVLAAAAGADIELLSTTEAAGAAAYSALTAAARRGALSRASIAASYRRILALKLRFARF